MLPAILFRSGQRGRVYAPPALPGSTDILTSRQRLSLPPVWRAARAASRRATGIRNGEQDT
jgi:hypothetical protein